MRTLLQRVSKEMLVFKIFLSDLAVVNFVQKYTLVVSEQTIDGDGVPNPDGKVFNGSYPGPWIQACWGDTISVTVINNLTYNGTTVHWHGIRQLGTLEMDGVNGVTQ
jgi:FtsP/CotA-like multicopper oxidase with cupredoxin domain